MGIKDSATAEYMNDNNVFADLFNYFVYDGEQVIKPNSLKEVDTRTDIVIKKHNYDTRYRDIIKRATIKQDGEIIYMAVRTMHYDVLQYRKMMKRKQPITPIITLVVYWGNKVWNKPTDLYGLFSITDKTVLKYVPNYSINLIDPNTLNDKDFRKFKTEIGKVFRFIQTANNKAKFDEIRKDSAYSDISLETAQLLNAVMSLNIDVDTRKERFNMCKAFEEILAENAEKNEKKGIEKGIEERNNELITKWRAQGKTEEEIKELLA